MDGRTDGRRDDLNWLERCRDKTTARTDEWKDGLSMCREKVVWTCLCEVEECFNERRRI